MSHLVGLSFVYLRERTTELGTYCWFIYVLSFTFFRYTLSCMKYDFFSMGNILTDILISVEDRDLAALGIQKGTMKIIDHQEEEKILRYLAGYKTKYYCGGSAANTMITLSELGPKVVLCGRAGNDSFGQIYIDRLSERKNLTSAIVREDGDTGFSIVLITPDYERSMNTNLGICKNFSPEDIDEKELKETSMLYFTGYMWDTENQKQAVMKALDICKLNDIKVAFDVADKMSIQRYRDDYLTIIQQHCDYVFANRKESATLFDNDNPEECAKLLSELGCTAIVKLGSKGALIKAPGADIIPIPVKDFTTCVDTTGAGDTFAAGFLYGLDKKKSLEEAGSFASIAASAIVAKFGGQFNKAEIEELKKKLD